MNQKNSYSVMQVYRSSPIDHLELFIKPELFTVASNEKHQQPLKPEVVFIFKKVTLRLLLPQNAAVMQ